MELQFVRVDTEKELRRLRDFDRRVFPPADLFSAAIWRECYVYWMLVGGRRVGCCALQSDTESEGTLYIASSGILPAWQGIGLGTVMKAWQVSYARRHGYTRIITETRAGNERMVRLNKSFGFRIVRKIPGYYVDPDEAGIEMALLLSRKNSR